MSAKVNEAYRVWMTLRLGSGAPAIGIDPGDFTITVRNPADDTTMVAPTVTESPAGGGLYRFDILAAFSLAHGPGVYAAVVEIDSTTPLIRDTRGSSIEFFGTNIDDVSYLGSIWIDTANGTAGTVVGVNGLPGLPVASLADALTLSTATGLRSIVVITGNLLLTASLTEFLVELRNESELDFGGQNINGTEFRGGIVKGSMTGRIAVEDSEIEDVSGFRGDAHNCGINGTITLGAGTSTFGFCHSHTPGTTPITISFEDSTAECNLRAFSGGVQVEDMVAAAHLMSAEFVAGQIIVDSSCTGGTLVIRGVVGPITDGSAGTTVVRTGEMSKASVIDDLLARVLTNSDLGASKSVGQAIGRLLTDLEVDIATQKLIMRDFAAAIVQRWPLSTTGPELVATLPGVQTRRGVPEL